MSDYILSLIRTAVPAAAGAVLAWLATRWGVVLNEQSSAALIVAAAALATAAYYALVRALEGRWPWIGRLLGAKAVPVYLAPGERAVRGSEDGVLRRI